MGSTDQTMDAFSEAPKRKATGFLVVAVLGLCGGAFAMARSQAPLLSADPYNWLLWARGDRLWAGVTVLALFLTVVGLIGWILRMLMPAAPKAKPAVRSKPVTYPVPTSLPAKATDDALSIPAAMARPVESRQVAPSPAEEPAPQLFSPPAVEITSLEPAVFHDNASDSFLSQNPVFVPQAGLQTSAQIIPLRPQFAPDSVAEGAPVAVEAAPHDPVETALLADNPAAPSPAPQSDMNAVISSAMHFVDPIASAAVAGPVTSPVAAPVAALLSEPTVVVPAATIITEAATAPVAEVAPDLATEPVPDDQAEIRQAVQMALSVWPDTTRAIAGDELHVRISRLYFDPAPESVRAFHFIATGDLKAAATAVQDHANALAAQGRNAEAAEQWRIIGAFNMGRDDARALAAYEKVSELDPSDSNIHLYLARRYQMSGDTTKMLPVLGRALAVISDPETRAELLTPYSDLKMKAGDARAAGDAFEELSRLHETTTLLKPDDIAARSTYAVTLARLAQAREIQGAFDAAGPAYKKAHSVFADLSARKPEHPGLRAMAENALKDAQRFSQ